MKKRERGVSERNRERERVRESERERESNWGVRSERGQRYGCDYDCSRYWCTYDIICMMLVRQIISTISLFNNT